MATTPNYGFIMPDPTDFVTDLPADFEIFGDEVDSRIKALNPETTAGDISYRGATANAKVRLGIGTAGQVLTVNSGATAPEWSTPSVATLDVAQIATGTLSGAQLQLSSLTSYDFLEVQIIDATNNTGAYRFRHRINNSSTQADYQYQEYFQSSGVTSGANKTWTTFIDLSYSDQGQNKVQGLRARYWNCKATGKTSFSIQGVFQNSTDGYFFTNTNGIFVPDVAISTLEYYPSVGNWSGGTYTLWGA